MLPEESVEYRLFGGDPSDRNYAHFDLLVGSSVSITQKKKEKTVLGMGRDAGMVSCRRDSMVNEVTKSAYQKIYIITHPHVRSTRNAGEGAPSN